MMKEIDIFNDESLQNDIQDLAAIEQAMIRKKYPLPDLDAELEKIVGTEEEVASADTGHRTVLRTLFAAVVGAAAMLATVLVWQWTQNRLGKSSEGVVAMNASHDGGMATIQTTEGEMITLTLADGTEVKLNSNSKLTYPHQFSGQERMIQLEGEAFFKVKHDAHRPFVVDAGGVLTKDLGTSFNISAYIGSDCKVTLVEGKVEVIQKNNDAHAPIVLAPGQQYSLLLHQTNLEKVTTVDTEETTAWADGVLYFHDKTLEYIVHSIADYYQVKVLFKNQRAKVLHLDFSMDKTKSLEEAAGLLNEFGIAKVSAKGGYIVVE